MMSALLLVLSCQLATAAFVAPPTMGRRAGTASATRISMSADLESWLTSKAGVSSKFIGSIIAKCDEEMIGSVENLATLNEAGMLDGIFKPVVAAGIAAALGNSGPVAATSSSAQMPLKEVILIGPRTVASQTAALLSALLSSPLERSHARRFASRRGKVKHLLMLNSQQTWGSEAALRARLDLFTLQSRLNAGGQWDPASQSWNNVVPLTSLNVGQGSGFTVPAQPAEFGGAQVMTDGPQIGAQSQVYVKSSQVWTWRPSTHAPLHHPPSFSEHAHARLSHRPVGTNRLRH